jgi:quinol-cytochrome oxidoreductase complex cytochrome b subunit
MSAEDLNEKGKGIARKIQEMFPFDWELIRVAGAEPVPRHLNKWWFALGGTPLMLFGIQILTGIALTFYYVPSPEEAYASVYTITNDIRFGWYIRSLHRWSSNFLIAAVFLHMMRVYFTNAYRHPRQLNWMLGFGLLGVMLIFGFTGYSLVYEQLSFWGATVACNIAEATPLIGPWLGSVIRGGPVVGENTLTRFFILHIAILPIAAMALIGLHVFLIRVHGVTELKFEGEEIPEKDRFFKFWPDHVATEMMIGVLMLYILTVVSLIFPSGLGAPADPTHTPEHIKPEWYFFFNFRVLKLTSLKMSVYLTGILGSLVFFWPFIEERLRRRFGTGDVTPMIIGIISVFGFLALTLWEALIT